MRMGPPNGFQYGDSTAIGTVVDCPALLIVAEPSKTTGIWLVHDCVAGLQELRSGFSGKMAAGASLEIWICTTTAPWPLVIPEAGIVMCPLPLVDSPLTNELMW